MLKKVLNEDALHQSFMTGSWSFHEYCDCLLWFGLQSVKYSDDVYYLYTWSKVFTSRQLTHAARFRPNSVGTSAGSTGVDIYVDCASSDQPRGQDCFLKHLFKGLVHLEYPGFGLFPALQIQDSIRDELTSPQSSVLHKKTF